MRYQRLTQEERYQIMALNNSGLGKRAIARNLRRSPSTISRELRRNKTKSDYRARSAHLRARKRRSRIHPPRRIQGEIEAIVRTLLSRQWSPEQISGRLRLSGIRIAHETIYRFVYSELEKNKKTYLNLRYQRRWRWTQEGRRRLKKGKNHYNQIFIDHRPEVVEKRRRLGDYERDTIAGRSGKSRILTIVDRTSRLTKMAKLSQLSSKLTHEKTVELLSGLPIYTITNDNGQEFAAHKYTAQKLNAGIYFNHPYASWERGTNENTNGLIRQYFPKGTNFDKVDDHKILEVERKLNNRPRKCLGYKTPLEVQRRLSQKCCAKT